MWGGDWHNGMMAQFGETWFWPMFGMHGIGAIVLFASFVFGVVFLAKAAKAPGQDPVQEAIAFRYANGEIDLATFEKMKRDVAS